MAEQIRAQKCSFFALPSINQIISTCEHNSLESLFLTTIIASYYSNSQLKGNKSLDLKKTSAIYSQYTLNVTILVNQIIFFYRDGGLTVLSNIYKNPCL